MRRGQRLTTHLREHLPRRTVRLRLTLVYGALFLASGGVLLVITDVLWNRTTDDQVSYPAAVQARITQILGRPPSGGGADDAALGTGIVRQGQSTVTPKQGRQVRDQLLSVAVHQHRSDLHLLILFSALAVVGMGIVAVVLGWVMAGRVLRPLRTITTTARDISATNLHERLKLEGPSDELRELGDTFDDLIARLEGSFQSQRQFVANASHELRTPLATMRASLDVAMAKPGPVPEQMSTLAVRLRDEFDQVDRLLEGLLALARAQRGMPADAAVPLDDLVSAAIQRRLPAIHHLDLAIEFEEYADTPVRGSEMLLSRMVENLLENAVIHNERGGWICATTRTIGANVRLVVENGGRVIGDGDPADLVQPFKRHGSDRTGSENGTGLGLSIVAAIAESHGGSVELDALGAGGLRVVVVLPAAVEAIVGAST